MLATGGYANVFYLSTNAQGCNATAIWRAYRRGACFANPCFTQIHPTCIPQLGELPVQAHADERVAPQRRPRLGAEAQGRQRARPTRSPRPSATTTSSGGTRPSATSRRATSPPAPRRRSATRAAASGRGGLGVYLDFARRDRAPRRADVIDERYGNLFEMYERITGEDPYEVPMRIYPAVHYTMGGLWVDYNLMSTVPGLFVARRGELLRPRRQPPRRQRADAGPGRRLLRPAVHDRQLPRPTRARDRSTPTTPAFAGRGARGARARPSGCSPSRARAPVDSFHRELGTHHVGPLRHGADAEAASSKALGEIPALREEFWQDVQRHRQRRGAEPGAGAGRPRRRLLRARRADVPRRAAPRGVLRRPLPRRVPDRGRRGAARRRRTSPTWRPGSASGDDERAGAAQGAARVRERRTRASGATSERSDRRERDHPATSGGRRRPTTRAAS